MQYALIADIHANREALEAVLNAIDRDYPRAQVLCPGDIVGYGPDPTACLDILLDRRIPCVRGNHEEMVTGVRDFSRCVAAGIHAATWTRRQLRPQQLDHLRALPIQRPIDDAVWMCHGDLLSADTYISDAAAGARALEQLARLSPSAQFLVCGHTHHAAVHSEVAGFSAVGVDSSVNLQGQGRSVINPGAVGQARDGAPSARFAVLDVPSRTTFFHRLGYDHETTEKKMRRAGLLGGVVLLPPQGPWRRVERARTRWARFWGDRDNRRRGFQADLGS